MALLRRSVELAKAARDEAGARPLRGRLGRTVRRGACRRLRIPRTLRTVRRGVGALASAPAGGPGRRRRRRARPGNRARRRRGAKRWSTWCARSACRPGSATPSTEPDPRRTTACRRVRGGRRGREIVAVGVNCCCARRRAAGHRDRRCRQAGDRLPEQRRALGRTAHWTGRAHFPTQLAAQWVAAGARIVGGCCRVGPADIAALRRRWGRRDSRAERATRRKISRKFALSARSANVRRSARRASGTPERCR